MQDYVDYDQYQLSLKEEICCVGAAIALSAVAGWILYRSVWGLLLIIFIFPLFRKLYQEEQKEKRKQRLLLEFKEAMQSVAASLLSGYSIENAWKEAEKELYDLYGGNGFMEEEMRRMNSGIQMNQPVEQLLYQFALRSSCEDILEFAEVFRFAKRSGGNFGKIIQNTIFRIGEKIETEREIQTILAGRKMEQSVMNIIPIGLLVYLNLTSKEFLAPLYGNFFGICVMSVAFLAYLAALILAKKMIQIQL